MLDRLTEKLLQQAFAPLVKTGRLEVITPIAVLIVVRRYLQLPEVNDLDSKHFRNVIHELAGVAAAPRTTEQRYSAGHGSNA